jgi:hypothetical protein
VSKISECEDVGRIAIDARDCSYTVKLKKTCRFEGEEEDQVAIIERGALHIAMDCSSRRMMLIAAGTVCYLWREGIARGREISWLTTRRRVPIGHRKFSLALTTRSQCHGYFVDPARCEIKIQHGTKKEIVERTLTAVQLAWQCWRADLLYDALFNRPEQREQLPAAEREKLTIDFNAAMEKIAREGMPNPAKRGRKSTSNSAEVQS